MTVDSAIRTRLLAISAVTALVSQRVYVLVLPPNLDTYPAIRVQQIGVVEDMHLRGSAGLLRARVQVDSVARQASGADPYASATAVDSAVHGAGDGTALNGWVGTAGSVEITGILPIDARPEYEVGAERLVKIMRDYFVFYRGY